MFMLSMQDVNVRQLAAVVSVVEEGTFARAASRLGFTQSAISQQIAALERATGLPVFDRPKGPKPVTLTPAGRLLLDYAREALREAAEMDSSLDRLRRGISGELTIGTFQSVSSKLLPSIIGRMRAEVPDVDVQLSETDDQEHLRRAILNDELDLAFTIDLTCDARLHVEVLGEDPFVVIAPRDQTSDTAVSLADLNARPLIGQPHNNSCQLMIDKRLRDAGLSPDYAYRFSDNAAVQSMVRSGMGWAVVPALTIDAEDPRIAVLQCDPPIPPRTLQLIRRADHTLAPSADTFTQVAREVTCSLLDPVPKGETCEAGIRGAAG